MLSFFALLFCFVFFNFRKKKHVNVLRKTASLSIDFKRGQLDITRSLLFAPDVEWPGRFALYSLVPVS